MTNLKNVRFLLLENNIYTLNLQISFTKSVRITQTYILKFK